MDTVQDIGNWIATYMGLSAYADLNPSTSSVFTPAGIDIDLGLVGINSARRIAERAHDFKYSETNAFLSIGAGGGSIQSAYQNASVNVAGTLSPNIAGNFMQFGTLDGLPFYSRLVSTVQYFLYNSGGAWVIAPTILTGLNDYWILVTDSINPSGTYTAQGANTGSAVATIGTASIGVKRVKFVSLPLGSGEYEPIEFMTSDQYTARQRMQIGRQNFNPQKTLGMLGVSSLGNPLSYQNGQTIYLAGNNITFPIVTLLSIVQWLPDYVDGSEADFVTQYAPEFLKWQGLLEVNKLLKRFCNRQEGNLDETAIESEASAALQTFITWDIGIIRGSSTPTAKMEPNQQSQTA